MKRGKKMDHTEEWREGSVEERLEYALVKVTALIQNSMLISTFSVIVTDNR